MRETAHYRAFYLKSGICSKPEAAARAYVIAGVPSAASRTTPCTEGFSARLTLDIGISTCENIGTLRPKVQ
jgi:hypothetical protein